MSAGMNMLGYHFNIDPVITGILSMSTSVLTGAALDPEITFKQAIEEIIPNVTGELAYYGVTLAGQAMGVDPRISHLAGIGIRSSLQAGLSGIGGGGSPGDWVNSAIQGMSQGITQIGLNYLVDEFDLNPLLANIGFSAIATAINGTLQSMLPGNENLDIFKFMFDTYKNNALVFLGSGASTDSWMEAAYAAQILDFTKIARERGIVDALNTYATGFFSSIAVNQMVTAAGTIGQYIKNKLDAGQIEQVDLENGETATGVRVEDTETILLFDSEGNVVGLKDGAKLIFGDIGIDGQGKMALFNGYIEGTYVPGLGLTMDIENGYATNARIIHPVTGETLYWVTPNAGKGYIYHDNFGDYLDAKIEYVQEDYKYSFEIKENEIYDFYYETLLPISEEGRELLATYGIYDINDLGRLYYHLTQSNNSSTPSYIYDFNEEITQLISAHPHLIGDIINLSTVAASEKSLLIDSLFSTINYENLQNGTVSRGTRYDLETVLNAVKGYNPNPLDDTVAILVHGTDFNQIWADIIGDDSYEGRDPNWADTSIIKYYLEDLGSSVEAFNWSGNTVTDVNAASIELANRIKQLSETYLDKKIAIAGHSAGDLVVKGALEKLREEGIKVDIYISMGSPDGDQNRIHDNLGEWYNISSSKDIISTPSTLLDNPTHVRYNDLAHTDYWGYYDAAHPENCYIGASGQIFRILLREEIQGLLQN